MNKDLSADLAGRYLPFLIEIRRRLLFVVCLFIIASILGFFYYDRVIRLILEVFRFQGINIVFTSPFQFIELTLNSSFLLGLVIVLPVVIAQILAFIKPALRRREYWAIVTLLPISLFLFLIGFAYGILMMRSTLALFYRQSQTLGVGNLLDVVHFLSVTISTAILMGLAFEFPVVLTLALRLKLLTLSSLTKLRAVFYLVSIVFIIFLPPSDILSDIILELPLALLFELTIIVNRLVFRPVK